MNKCDYCGLDERHETIVECMKGLTKFYRPDFEHPNFLKALDAAGVALRKELQADENDDEPWELYRILADSINENATRTKDKLNGLLHKIFEYSPNLKEYAIEDGVRFSEYIISLHSCPYRYDPFVMGYYLQKMFISPETAGAVVLEASRLETP